MTHLANHDTLCHKSHYRKIRNWLNRNFIFAICKPTMLPMHWKVGLLWKVVVLTVITTTFSEWLPPKERTAPQHTRSFCRRFTRQNPSPVLRGRSFSFPGSCNLKISCAVRMWYRLSGQRRCKTGAGTSFGSNGDQHTRAAELSTYFCVLTIRKQFSEIRFERSGGGQESSRGHKFSILENSCPFGTASCWGVPAPNPARWFHSWWLLYCLYAFSNPDLLYMINL